MRVMIVDDERSVLDCLKRIVNKLGYSVELASNGREALERFAGFEPHVLLTDIQMPEMGGLELLRRIREQNTDVVVIVMTGLGSEEVAVEALRLQANNYLKKPFEISEIRDLLKKYEAVHEHQVQGRAVEQMVVRRTFEVETESEVEKAPLIAEWLVKKCAGVLPDSDLLGVRLGLVELIVNAIEHGNLEISFEEKRQAADSADGLTALYNQRLSDPELGNRTVKITFNVAKGHCEWIIADQGKGFNWRDLPDPLNDRNFDRPSGRGIFLSRMQFDKLEYMEKGNVVRAVKSVSDSTEADA